MSKTIYRLRLFIEETSQYFPIHLFALKDKQPTFHDLMNKIENIDKDRNLNDYQITVNDSQHTILCDNESLRNALKSSATDQTNLEIGLSRKNNKLLGLDDLNLRKYSMTPPPRIQTNFLQKIPVIKPAVLRWTPTILPTNIDNHSFYSDRKDSGISFDDEPLRKKQRMMSADHPRKLPSPNSINFDHTLHPLEIRRPSTAPLPSPSPPQPPVSFKGPTLPAISSITSNLELAPINNKKRSRSTVQTTVFVCEHETNGKLCGQTFRRSYDLSRHQTIHLENRPFCYCEKCGRRFTRMDALRRHERVQGHTSSSKQRSMSTSVLPLRKTTSV